MLAGLDVGYGHVKWTTDGARVERLVSTDEGDALDWVTADPWCKRETEDDGIMLI